MIIPPLYTICQGESIQVNVGQQNAQVGEYTQ